MEKQSEKISDTVSEAILNIKKDPPKESKKDEKDEGVNLLEITKKLSDRKFGKK